MFNENSFDSHRVINGMSTMTTSVYASRLVDHTAAVSARFPLPLLVEVGQPNAAPGASRSGGPFFLAASRKERKGRKGERYKSLKEDDARNRLRAICTCPHRLRAYRSGDPWPASDTAARDPRATSHRKLHRPSLRPGHVQGIARAADSATGSFVRRRIHRTNCCSLPDRHLDTQRRSPAGIARTRRASSTTTADCAACGSSLTSTSAGPSFCPTTRSRSPSRSRSATATPRPDHRLVQRQPLRDTSVKLPVAGVVEQLRRLAIERARHRKALCCR